MTIIDVVQSLHNLKLWREGADWPDADAQGEYDHLIFRLAGYRRYSLWLHRMETTAIQKLWPAVNAWDEKEQRRDTFARGLVAAFYNSMTAGDSAVYKFMECLELMRHVPDQTNNLVRDAKNSGLVDMSKSKALLDVLRGQLDQIYNYTAGSGSGAGVVTYKEAPFHWWSLSLRKTDVS